MTTKHRYAILFVFIAMILLSLACTLGGTAETAPTDTPVAQITVPPSVAPPTIGGSLVVPSPSDTPSGPPTNTPTATPTPIVGSGPGGCVLKGTYIADVTIPDGTLLAPNAPFVKTWRIRNDGACSWDAAYQLVFAEGNQMSGPAAVNIPTAAPGQTIDISVNLAAPGSTGEFTGKWRLRASNNAIFGGYTVVIKVAGTPTPTPTATKTATPAGGIWSGTWDTTFGTMNLVQGGNNVTGFYNNGTSTGSINATITGNRLSGTYTEGGVTGSVDFWIEGTGLRWHGNFNKTQAWCGQRVGQTPLSTCGVSTWYGTWITDCGPTDPCGEMTLTQSGDSVGGTYAGGTGTVNGTVNGTELMGTLRQGANTATFKFFMTSNGQQFQGNWNTSNAWCGHRSGSSLPSPCKLP